MFKQHQYLIIDETLNLIFILLFFMNYIIFIIFSYLKNYSYKYLIKFFSQRNKKNRQF